MTNIGDKWLGDPALRRSSRSSTGARRWSISIRSPRLLGNLLTGCRTRLIEFRTTPAARSRACSSAAAWRSFPDIRFIFSHAGGTIPFLSGRILHSGSNRAYLDRAPKGVDYELRKLHYDVALASFKPALAALFAYIPVSQVLLGSDFPFSSIGLSLKGLEEHGLPNEFSTRSMAAMPSG